MQFFSRHHRKTFRKVEAHLGTEAGNSARARAVVFARAVVQNVLEEVMILFHVFKILKPNEAAKLKKA